MNSNKTINTTRMYRIGIITIPNSKLYKEDYNTLSKKSSSPTQFFFNEMVKSSYTNGVNCIFNLESDANLIVARFENDAIILFSENPVLSPEQFMHFIMHLQKCTNNMNKYLSEINPSNYSAFALPNLSINFAKIELVTDLPAPVIKQNFLANEDQIAADLNYMYSEEKSTIAIKQSSTYGVNFCAFLEQIIRLNPDIRLLMSNINCSKKAIKQTTPVGYRIAVQERTKHNKSYDIFYALQFVLNSFGDFNSLNTNYYLEWYNGKPDTGYTSINYALNLMLDSPSEEVELNIRTPRTLPEVKSYISTLNSSALKANFTYADIEASSKNIADARSH